MKKPSFLLLLLVALTTLVGLLFLLQTPVYKTSQAGVKYCSEACSADNECQDGHVCFQGFCRRSNCPEKKDCRCDRQECNSECLYNSDCITGLCSQGVCRNLGCPVKNDCWCGN